MDPEGYWFKFSKFEIEPGEDKDTNPGIYGRQLAVWPTPRRPWLTNPAGTVSLRFLLRSRTGHNIHVLAFATVLLTRVPSFGRFDEITHLVEKTSALTRSCFGWGAQTFRITTRHNLLPFLRQRR